MCTYRPPEFQLSKFFSREKKNFKNVLWGCPRSTSKNSSGKRGAVSTPTVSVFYLLIRTLCTFWISPRNQGYLCKNQTKHSQIKNSWQWFTTLYVDCCIGNFMSILHFVFPLRTHVEYMISLFRGKVFLLRCETKKPPSTQRLRTSFLDRFTRKSEKNLRRPVQK